jgi:hypothetical protein
MRNVEQGTRNKDARIDQVTAGAKRWLPAFLGLPTFGRALSSHGFRTIFTIHHASYIRFSGAKGCGVCHLGQRWSLHG